MDNILYWILSIFLLSSIIYINVKDLKELYEWMEEEEKSNDFK